MKQLFTTPINQVAATYGQCSYNSSQFNSGQVCGATTTSSGGGTTTSGLADTGTAVLLFVTIASVLILAAMLVRIWRRPAKTSN